MTKADVIKTLRSTIKRYPTLQDAGAALKVTPQYLSDVLRGRREPGPKILKALGLERTVLYGEMK